MIDKEILRREWHAAVEMHGLNSPEATAISAALDVAHGLVPDRRMSEVAADLLPCPFCGGRPHIESWSPFYVVHCLRCLVTTSRPYESAEEVLSAWNTRAVADEKAETTQ